jgi:dipeptidyl aminopeptidase/acylaminoacyl peptidase
LDIAATTPARFIRWKDASGQTITGQLFAARRTGDRAPAPLFINYYNCSGFVRGGFGDEWPLASLAEHGISALCINYAPLKIDAVERYDKGLEVVRSAIDLLASEGEIDRTRVGMGGLSLGTEMTLWTAVNSDLLAAVSVSSIGHTPLGYTLRKMYDSFPLGLRKYWQLGSPDETPERWRRLSIVFNLDKIRAPILMQLPEQEYLVTLDYAVPLVKERMAELYVFPNEAHNKFQPKHKLAVYERNLDWFRFWLQDFEDSDPNKAEQNKHWREMRKRVNERG